MSTYKFTVDATRERFMERPQHEVLDYYIIADTRDQAHSYVMSFLHNGGWNIRSITGEEIIVVDAREGLQKKPRQQVVPCDVTIKRPYRMYVTVDEGADTNQVVAAAKKMLVESDYPDAELVPDPEIFSEIEEQDITWVGPDWDGAYYDDTDDEEEPG